MTNHCTDSETIKPLTDRLRAAGNGESFQLHWLVEAAKEIDRLGLLLRMIEEAAPDEWSRSLARKARNGTAVREPILVVEGNPLKREPMRDEFVNAETREPSP